MIIEEENSLTNILVNIMMSFYYTMYTLH